MSAGNAHYVVVDRHGHRVWSQHGGAATFHRDLLWGPERTLDFIHRQRGGHAAFWMNSVWWQAVALLDLHERRLFVHTEREIAGYPRTGLREIRAWLEIMAALWPGWTVTWAPRGLYQIMEYLGLPYDTVLYLDEPPSPLTGQWAQAPTEDDDLTRVASALITVRDQDGRLSFRGCWASGLAEPLLSGPATLASHQEEALEFAVLESIPWSGAFLDVPARRLDWWSLDCLLDPAWLAPQWSGWTLTDHGDAFEEVAALIGPELLLDAGTDDGTLRRVADWFARHTADSHDRERLLRIRPVERTGALCRKSRNSVPDAGQAPCDEF
ncbi:hypothetical protein ACFOWE_26625 [Planomonospora corallina]|uniref:Uncharacterized protein n=1 Tax=Planomonospora corallina TaxID=1806052 RepID=A0ABV8ICV6_9ACTN